MSVKPMKLSEVFEGMADQLSLADVISARLQTKIAVAITKKRLEYGMTQKEFAQKMQVSQGMVSKWESEDYNFTIESLAQIAEKLEWNLDITLTSESDQYKKIDKKRHAFSAWQGNCKAGNIIELNKAV